MNAAKAKSSYPPGAIYANWFSLFNAISFQIVFGTPAILYAKSLGAPATALGIIASLSPFLSICQIPAAHFLGRFGYKRFTFAGWGLRTFCVFLIALIPLMSSLGNPAKLRILIASLFVFNLLRGIAAGAWLPWITALIPEPQRGRFISRDQFCLNFGSLAAILVCAYLLSEESQPWQFSLVFLLSTVGGWISLLFIKLMPDIAPGETLKQSNTAVPWREIVTYPPFFRLTFFVFLIMISAGCAGVFGVAFLKSQLHFGQSRILFINTLFFLGALVTLPLVGRIIDRIGNKTTLAVSLGILCVGFFTWSLLAAEALTPSLLLINTLYFTGGMAGAGIAVAQNRLMMSTMPEMGRNHFFAFFSVITSIGTGCAPIGWGMMIDSLDHFSLAQGPLHWNTFAVYYSLQFVIMLATTAWIAALIDKKPTR